MILPHPCGTIVPILIEFKKHVIESYYCAINPFCDSNQGFIHNCITVDSLNTKNGPNYS